MEYQLRKLAYKLVYCDTQMLELYREKYLKPASEIILDQTMLKTNIEKAEK